MRAFLVVALILFATNATHAQTLIGLKTECGVQAGKFCKSSFEIRNDGVKPLNFSIDSSSVHFDKQAQRPVRDGLEAGVIAQLSQSSGRLSPKETRIIDFKVSCASLPCVVAFATSMVVGHNSDGVAVALVLPHYVYVDTKAEGARLRILQAAGVVPPEQRPR